MGGAAARVEAVGDDADGRLALRGAFYARHGGAFAALGRAELEFIRWEVARGLLAPLDAPRPGSPYWRAAQAAVACDAEAAADALAAGVAVDEAPEGVRLWGEAIRRPDPSTWYAAHNRSLVLAMRACAAAARGESEAEQRFIDAALRRVLAAELLARGDVRSPLRGLARLVADPRHGAVRALTRVAWLYPRTYPLPSGWMDHPVRRVCARVERALARWVLDPAAAASVTAAHLRALFGAGDPSARPVFPAHVPVPDPERADPRASRGA